MIITELIKNKIMEKVSDYHKLKEEYKEQSNKINYAGRVYDELEIKALVSSALDFWLTHGERCNLFEKKLKEFLNIKYCNVVNSGSSANLLAFMALTSPLLEDRKITRNNEIITTSCCFPTTISPILNYGAIPVFVDITLNTLNIDIEEMKKALSKNTKAVIIAHTLGNPFNIDEVKKFCDNNNLWLIEDNCDSLGSLYNGKLTGTFGDIGTSSFYPPHHITTGEGGAVYTNDKLLNKILVSLRDWGRDCICSSGEDNKCGNRFNKQFGTLPFGYDHKYVYSHAGYNLKMTEMQAAIGIEQLKKLPDFIQKRKDNFNYLYEHLHKLSDFINLPIKYNNSDPSWFGFWITLKNNKYSRNDIVKYLEENNIQTRNIFAGNIIRQPLFQYLQKNIDYRIIGDLCNTDIVMNNTFWIGVYPGLIKEHLDFIINKIYEFFN